MAILIDGRPPGAFWQGFEGQISTLLPGGLINQTWRVGTPPVAILQRLHSIFTPDVNHDIDVITTWLHDRGMPTPRIIPCDDGALSVVDGEGACWRALTWMEGDTHHQVRSPAMAAGAGALVAQWHRAIDGLDHAFAFVRMGVHDTEKHLERMRLAVQRHGDHRLVAEVAPAVDALEEAWSTWSGRVDLPTRLCHGDLKISNLLFSPGTSDGFCLVDLDTMSQLSLDVELGDAWRSWCNRSGEDVNKTVFDLTVFEASATAYLAEYPLSQEVLETLPAGVERICLELTSRFLADALEESYFGWDETRAPTRGEHNLLRARGQLALAGSVRKSRIAMEKILGI